MVTNKRTTRPRPYACRTCGEPITRPKSPTCYQVHPPHTVPTPPPAAGGSPNPQPVASSAPATAAMINGYPNPGPYQPTASKGPGYAERTRNAANKRHTDLQAAGCDCSVCIIWGPEHCPGENAQPLDLTIEQARAARVALKAAGERQKQIVALKVEAIQAGHCRKRTNKAAAILDTPGALERAAEKYQTTATGCQCPDAQHSQARGCKHQIAVIMQARIDRDEPARIDELDKNALPLNTADKATRDADGMLWA